MVSDWCTTESFFRVPFRSKTASVSATKRWRFGSSRSRRASRVGSFNRQWSRTYATSVYVSKFRPVRALDRNRQLNRNDSVFLEVGEDRDWWQLIGGGFVRVQRRFTFQNNPNPFAHCIGMDNKLYSLQWNSKLQYLIKMCRLFGNWEWFSRISRRLLVFRHF